MFGPVRARGRGGRGGDAPRPKRAWQIDQEAPSDDEDGAHPPTSRSGPETRQNTSPRARSPSRDRSRSRSRSPSRSPTRSLSRSRSRSRSRSPVDDDAPSDVPPSPSRCPASARRRRVLADLRRDVVHLESEMDAFALGAPPAAARALLHRAQVVEVALTDVALEADRDQAAADEVAEARDLARRVVRVSTAAAELAAE